MNLKTLEEINKRIKFQAKDYYDRYKKIKHQFNRERKELKTKNLNLEHEHKINQQETSKNNVLYGDFVNHLGLFKKKLGLKDVSENQDEDVIQMVQILNTVKDRVDIYEGLTPEESNQINCLLDFYNDEKKVFVKENIEEENNQVANEVEVRPPVFFSLILIRNLTYISESRRLYNIFTKTIQ